MFVILAILFSFFVTSLHAARPSAEQRLGQALQIYQSMMGDARLQRGQVKEFLSRREFGHLSPEDRAFISKALLHRRGKTPLNLRQSGTALLIKNLRVDFRDYWTQGKLELNGKIYKTKYLDPTTSRGGESHIRQELEAIEKFMGIWKLQSYLPFLNEGQSLALLQGLRVLFLPVTLLSACSPTDDYAAEPFMGAVALEEAPPSNSTDMPTPDPGNAPETNTTAPDPHANPEMAAIVAKVPSNIPEAKAAPKTDVPFVMTDEEREKFAGLLQGREGRTMEWDSATGESFPSIGIGHYSWYPRTVNDTDAKKVESFPLYISFMEKNCGLAIPSYLLAEVTEPDPTDAKKTVKVKRLLADAPWNDKAAFDKALLNPKSIASQLKTFLEQKNNKICQVKFQEARLAESIEKMKLKYTPISHPQFAPYIEGLLKTRPGFFAALDYVNFKGDGTDVTFDSYDKKSPDKDGDKEFKDAAGQALKVQWGLEQVLLKASQDGPANNAVVAFRDSALQVMKRRARNAPTLEKVKMEESLLVEKSGGWDLRIRGYLPTK